jgi:Flp pilus assembly protein TadD
VAAIERACELEPMNPTYLKQGGRIFALAGNNERAIHFYRKAIEWGEDDPAVRQAIDTLTRGSGRRGFFGKAG